MRKIKREKLLFKLANKINLINDSAEQIENNDPGLRIKGSFFTYITLILLFFICL